MRLKHICCAAALLTALLIVPAHALEYGIEAPDAGLFARSTSDDPIYMDTAPANQDRSKNAALVAPGFGTPTSYLPGSGEALTPNLITGTGGSSPGTLAEGWTVTSTTTGAGTVAPPTSSAPPAQTGPDFSVTYPATAFTDVTSDLYYSGGHLGTLKIPAIGLSVKVYQGTESTPLSKGAGHFEDTSIWAGNVALAGHNRGVANHFGKIHTLDLGDRITFTTKLGTRTYEVVSVAQVSETDRSGLTATKDNRITLYTCVRNQRELRWRVEAVEV